MGTEESKRDFAIILFVGMIIHGLFAECVTNALGLILENVKYVKKVVFPLEVLPWVAMGSALFHVAVSLALTDDAARLSRVSFSAEHFAKQRIIPP